MSRGRRLDALVSATARDSARADWRPWAAPGGASSYPSAIAHLGPCEVEGLLLHDWRAHREVRVPADSLLAKGVTIEGLPEGVDIDAVQSWLEGDSDRGVPGLLGSLTELWAESAAYGGAIMVAVTDDGRPPSEPLDRSAMRTIVSWEVVDRWSCWPFRRGGIAAPVDYWVLSGTHLALERASQIIHPSRVAVLTGRWMPRRWRDLRDGWGPSRLELLETQRQSLLDGHKQIGRLLRRTSQDVIALTELSEMVTEVGPEYIQARLKTQAATLETDGVLLLDGGIEADTAGNRAARRADKFESVPRPLGGVDAVANVQHVDWRRGSDMPSVVADGDQAVGLGGGSEVGPLRAWDATCDGLFKRELLGWLNWGLGLIFAAKEGPTRGKVPVNWTAKRNPIAEPDRKLEAEIAEIETRTDIAAKDGGTLGDTEIRQWRNVDGKHGRVRVETASMLPELGETEVAGELAAAAASGGDVQRQALNGAQIQALFDLSVAVTQGLLPAEVARWLVDLAVPGLETTGVTQAMAVAERWTNPKAEVLPAPTPAAMDSARAFVQAFDLRATSGRQDAVRFDAWAAELWRADWAHDDAGVFVCIPDALAVQFPYKPHDTSPPHVTVLYIGPTSYDQITEVREVVAKTAQAMGALPCRARFGDLRYFEQGNGKRVAYVAVEFDPDLADYHAALRENLMSEGVMVQHRNDWWHVDSGQRQDGPWVAHATLAYLEAGQEFEGRVPVGEWTVERFEVWHGESR